MSVRLQIDVKKSLESRNIFADPEQLMGLRGKTKPKDEYRKTFIIPGGIPINAIHRWDILHEYDLLVGHDNDLPRLNKERR